MDDVLVFWERFDHEGVCVADWRCMSPDFNGPRIRVLEQLGVSTPVSDEDTEEHEGRDETAPG